MTTSGRVRIEAPNGQSVYADDPAASELISSLLGRRLRLENQPQVDEKTGIDRRTVFGDVPVSQMKPDWTPETMPDYIQLKTGTFFEIGAVYLLGSGSVGHLRELQGGTALIDRRRFRPNIYIDTGPATDRFVEDEWIGGTLEVGGTVLLDEFQPTLWCVTSTLAQEELPRGRQCAAYDRAVSLGLPRGLRLGPASRYRPGQTSSCPPRSRSGTTAQSVFRSGCKASEELISSRQIPMVNALPHNARFRASNRGRLDTSSVPPQPRATQCCGLHFDRGASCTGVWVSPRWHANPARR